MPKADSIPDVLCLACGLCCNGVIFKDVELRRDDDAVKLIEAGLAIEERQRGSSAKVKFPQPCAVLCSDNRCHIYTQRPCRCRQFECLLFQAVSRGETELAAALRLVHEAQRRAARVVEGLRQLGDTRDAVALSLRFQHVRRRLERNPADEETAARFADLSLAVHDLNLLLGEHFYR